MSVLSLLRSVSPAGLYPPLRSSSGLAGHRTDPSVFGLRCGLCQGPLSHLRARPADMVGAGDAHGALHRELPHRACRAPAPRTEGLPRHLRSGLCRRRRSLRRGRAPAAWTKLSSLHSWRRLTQGLPTPSRSGTAPALLPEAFSVSPSAGSSSPRADFARARDASKVGFVALNCHLQRWGYLMNDGKHLSGRLCQLGFLPVQRAAFDALLAMACTGTGQEGRWAVDQTLNLAAWNPRAMSALH